MRSRASRSAPGSPVSRRRAASTATKSLPEGFATNHAGGVLGGISTGQPITVSIAIKPTSSIRTPRRSIDRGARRPWSRPTVATTPASGIRATPIAEAMLALVLIDHALRHRAQNADVRVGDAARVGAGALSDRPAVPVRTLSPKGASRRCSSRTSRWSGRSRPTFPVLRRDRPQHHADRRSDGDAAGRAHLRTAVLGRLADRLDRRLLLLRDQCRRRGDLAVRDLVGRRALLAAGAGAGGAVLRDLRAVAARPSRWRCPSPAATRAATGACACGARSASSSRSRSSARCSIGSAWRCLPAVLLALLRAAVLAVAWCVPEAARRSDAGRARWAQLREPVLARLLRSCFLMLFAHAALYSFYSLHLDLRLLEDRDRPGLDPRRAGRDRAVSGAATGCSSGSARCRCCRFSLRLRPCASR